ncbi:DUF1479-domain-containing protein [Pleurostoma richardsiae]|uniref:DUF1479-domain-containing protein n=1 Tax=Pleurostoma richardsiae TaxID=41990 RepID=A0AA38RND7_9PEZI|nr:DUF1479-domain-containing protein [Pleurostoma richardsiae]
MSGSLEVWPQWPEFSAAGGELDDYCLNLKRKIIDQYGEETLRSSWLQVCSKLEMVTAEVAKEGTNAIPVLSFSEMEGLTEVRKMEIASRGCCVVRGVIPETEARQWFDELKIFITDNEGSHSTEADTSEEPLTYCDAFKIRVPGIPFLGLGPHMNAGSLCRWADDNYRKVYDAIFSGHPSEVDLYDLGLRKDANQAMFDKGAQSTVLRTFQGWTSITPLKPNEGGMLLYPNLETVVAYVLLRPFFKEPEQGEVLDASKWTLDPDSPWFPGTFRDKSQMVSISSHPHLRLRDCMVHLPAMEPGDTVWWHSDMLHAVEVNHDGPDDTAVIYIAATPTTEPNKEYIAKQLQDFRDGHIPHDFRPGFDADERRLKGFVGEAAILGEAGRKAFGITV